MEKISISKILVQFNFLILRFSIWIAAPDKHFWNEPFVFGSGITFICYTTKGGEIEMTSTYPRSEVVVRATDECINRD